MFIPLAKVDTAQRLVYGRIDETPDRVGEVFDYASSKPHIERWSADLAKASDGKSLGNIRVMHQLKAAGVLTGLWFDDAAKSVDICAHIVDDEEWAKVESGVYTGFSPGGRKRFLDGSRSRYTAFPSEISLVDLPCIPSATFTLLKADGAVEERRFAAASGTPGTTSEAAQRIHDLACSLGAACGSGEAGLAKLDAGLAATLDDLRKAIVNQETVVARIVELERRPLGGGPRLHAIDRGTTRDAAPDEALTKADALPADTPARQLAKATALTRLALLQPRTLPAKGE
jgi:hypothetical protein